MSRLVVLLEEMRQEVAELSRRLSNLVMPGQIVAIDPPRTLCRFRAGDLVTGWVRWLSARAGDDRDWWCPSVGEQAVLISPDGEPNQGWVIPAGYSDAHPAPDDQPHRHVLHYADGMKVVHDNRARRLVLDGWEAEGTIELRAKNVVIKTGDRGFLHLDHAGRATRITHLGDTLYETRSWITGSTTVDAGDQGFHPPEVEDA